MSILIDSDTTFIVQGITGREAVNLTRECLDYGHGAKIVGGVTPGRLGRDVHGVPVFDTVAQAVEHHGGPINGSVVTVPPAFTKDAVFEAIDNGIELVVIVTERIPRRDVAEMVELATERGARIIGPNCLGIIVPDVIKMGGIGGPAKDAAKAYTPGPVGVMSRSGGMTTEISSTLTAAGLGQSTAVSIGGDAIIGSTYTELMPLFEADDETQAIVIYTEPGGRMEAELAGDVTENDSRLPIVAFMAGRFMDEMPGMSFGHAGTIVEGKADTAAEKIARLQEAGIVVAEEIAEIPELVTERLATKVVERLARERGADEALRAIDEEGSVTSFTFAQVADRAARVAGGLAALGVGRGDVVMTLMGARPEWVFTLLGVWRLGAVVLPCSEQLRRKDIALRLEATRPRAVIAAQRDIEELEAALSNADPQPALRKVDAGEMPDAEPIDPVRTEIDEPALMIFTSGTSGEPRCVVHVQRYLQE